MPEYLIYIYINSSYDKHISIKKGEAGLRGYIANLSRLLWGIGWEYAK